MHVRQLGALQRALELAQELLVGTPSLANEIGIVFIDPIIVYD